MSKTLDPIIVNPPKKGAVQPFTKEDIVKIAFDVLADLGDEVINKAIEDGKISIPQNINVEDLPIINKAINNLSNDEVENLKGKCWYSTVSSSVVYPLSESPAKFFTIVTDELYTVVYIKPDNSWIKAFDGTYKLSEIVYIDGNPTLAGTESELTGLQIGDTKYKVGGTTLYKHTVTFSASAPLEFISLVKTALTRGDDLISWNKAGKIINGTLSTYGRIISIFADSNNNYKETVVYTLDNFDGSSQDFYDKVALTDFAGDTVTEL